MSMKKWLLKTEPRAVQLAALDICNLRSCFAYFMEMRLGKTAVILNELVELVNKNKIDGIIINCPNSLKEDWIRQAHRFLPIEVRYAAWPDLPEKTDNKTGKIKPFFLTINYEAYSVGGAKAVSIVDKF